MAFDQLTSRECGITDIKGEEFVYTWFIKNFICCNFDNERKLKSPEFSFGKEKGNRWELRLYTNPENQEYLTIVLNLNYDDQARKEAYLIISLIDKTGNRKVSAENFFLVKVKDFKPREFSNFVKKDYVVNKENGLLKNGTLTVECKLYYRNNIAGMVQIENSFKEVEQTNLRKFEILFENKSLSDVSIIVGGETFAAHKCILAAQSRVFLAMFEHNMQEKNECILRINDIDSKIMQGVLRFMYSGKIENSQNVDELLMAAEKYELDNLKVICEKELFSKLTVDNAGKTLFLADRYKAEELKKCVLKFISAYLHKIDLDKFEIDVDKQSSLFVDILRELSVNRR